jgi:hypothetical protein
MNSFDLVKFRNQLLAENTNRFYAPTYIVQKYGADKAKEIEANIEDEGANTWDLFTSLETPQEVDNFIGGFLSENTLSEDLSYLAAWKVLKGPGGYIFQIQGENRDTIGARVNKAGMVTLDGEGAGAAQAVQQIADQFGTETEVLYGDDSLTTVISEPDFNAIFPDTISEVKMTRADEVGSDGVAEEDALDETLNLDPSSPQISQYWDIMVKNQPEDTIKTLTDLTAGRLSFKDFLDTTEDDIFDSFRDEFMDLDEGTLEEMASFYKVADDSPEAKAAIAAAKEKYKPGTTLYNTLDTLEKTGEIDYKELAKSTGKDMATFNNPKSREVLEKDLAAFVQAGASPSAVRTGRPADPNKSKASPKLKITNPKPKSTSTKLADLAPADVFSGMGPDEEEMEMEKQAVKAAKGNKRLGTTVEKLAQVTKEMKSLAKAYQAAKGTPEEAGIVAQLKDLTAEKKALEKKTAPRQMSAADLMGGEEA